MLPTCVAVWLPRRDERTCVGTVVPASILARSPAHRRAEEVNAAQRRAHRSTDDLHERRERIKCLSSAPLIPLSRLPFISPSFLGVEGAGLAVLWGVVAGCGNQGGGGYYYYY